MSFSSGNVKKTHFEKGECGSIQATTVRPFDKMQHGQFTVRASYPP